MPRGVVAADERSTRHVRERHGPVGPRDRGWRRRFGSVFSSGHLTSSLSSLRRTYIREHPLLPGLPPRRRRAQRPRRAQRRSPRRRVATRHPPRTGSGSPRPRRRGHSRPRRGARRPSPRRTMASCERPASRGQPRRDHQRERDQDGLAPVPGETQRDRLVSRRRTLRPRAAGRSRRGCRAAPPVGSISAAVAAATPRRMHPPIPRGRPRAAEVIPRRS